MCFSILLNLKISVFFKAQQKLSFKNGHFKCSLKWNFIWLFLKFYLSVLRIVVGID